MHCPSQDVYGALDKGIAHIESVIYFSDVHHSKIMNEELQFTTRNNAISHCAHYNMENTAFVDFARHFDFNVSFANAIVCDARKTHIESCQNWHTQLILHMKIPLLLHWNN